MQFSFKNEQDYNSFITRLSYLNSVEKEYLNVKKLLDKKLKWENNFFNTIYETILQNSDNAIFIISDISLAIDVYKQQLLDSSQIIHPKDFFIRVLYPQLSKYDKEGVTLYQKIVKNTYSFFVNPYKLNDFFDIPNLINKEKNKEDIFDIVEFFNNQNK